MNDPTRKVDHEALEHCVQMLENTGDYRVLRRLPPLVVTSRRVESPERIAIVVDTETTGLDPFQDEVVEIAAIAVSYDVSGQITDIVGSMSALREPSVPFGDDLVQLTGISPEMLRGQQIDKAALDAFVSQGALIVAHNAAFDRPFCEGVSDIFRHKPWACSATEVNWKDLGFEGIKLTYLVNRLGWFYNAHRALDDCNALVCVLSSHLPGPLTETPFMHLLTSARTTRLRVSVQAPFSARATLRAKGFRWLPAAPGRRGNWYVDVAENELASIKSYLHENKISDGDLQITRMTALNRYRTLSTSKDTRQPMKKQSREL